MDSASQENIIEKLIEEVQKYPSIWDKLSDSYKDTAKKQVYFNEIGQRIGLTGKDAYAKWRNLRDTYARLKKPRPTGSAGRPIKWPYMRALSFLDSVPSSSESRKTNLNLDDAQEQMELSLNHSGEDGDDDESQMSASPAASERKSSKRKKKEDSIDDALLMAISEATKPKDENELFGEIVAHRLSALALRHPYYAAQARQRIDQILMEFEFSPQYQDPNPFSQLSKTSAREAISAEERLVIAIRYLATGDSFHHMSLTFRVSHNAISKIVSEVSKAIWDILSPIYLKAPSTEDEWISIAKNFFEKWNTPLVLGCLDGKHILLRKPSKSGSLFYNYKGTTSIVLLAVSDYKYRFIFVDIGGFGYESDSRLFANSKFKKAVESGHFNFPDPTFLPGSDKICHYHFLADSAFPLELWLQKPFIGENLPIEKRIFNYRLSRGRRVVENAFGIATAKWRTLQRHIETQSENAIRIVQAIVCLHNFLIDESDHRHNPTSMSDSPERQDGIWRTQVGVPLASARMQSAYASKNKKSAEEMRMKIVDYYMNEGSVAWQNAMVQ